MDPRVTLSGDGVGATRSATKAASAPEMITACPARKVRS